MGQSFENFPFLVQWSVLFRGGHEVFVPNVVQAHDDVDAMRQAQGVMGVVLSGRPDLQKVRFSILSPGGYKGEMVIDFAETMSYHFEVKGRIEP